ncbi:MAG: DNA/RNA nuclease SfsA [Eubacterium sp.]
MNLSDFPIVEGNFISRPNRFIARVMIVDGDVEREITAHVPNTGRMSELLVSGARVKMAYNPAPYRKTDYTLLTVKFNEIWVCVHSTIANALAFEYMKAQPGVNALKREVTYGNSRFDLAFEKEGYSCLYEVKSANLVIGSTAMFPDAPTERGSKHLEELMKAYESGHMAGVLFVIQREDAEFFMPNKKTDPKFSNLLKKSFDLGLDIHALRCLIDGNTIVIDSEIPIKFEENIG